MAERDKIRKQIKEAITKSEYEKSSGGNALVVAVRYWKVDKDKAAELILSIPEIAVVDREAKVPIRRKYERTIYNAHNLAGEIYLQGQIDAQQDMLDKGYVLEVE